MITSPRGVHDVLPNESWRWHWLEQQFVETCRLFGFREVRLPFFEETELFQRGVGEATDIVRKEMYTFTDRSNRSLTLRPEITAGIVRSFIQHKMYSEALPLRLFTYGPLFRYERPQTGRYRQFSQFDIEIFGSTAPQADVEVIALGMELFRRIGLEGIEVQLNTIGCNACRPDGRGTGICIHKDDMPIASARDCDVLVMASPVFWWNFNATSRIFMERLYCLPFNLWRNKKVKHIFTLNHPVPSMISQSMTLVWSYMSSYMKFEYLPLLEGCSGEKPIAQQPELLAVARAQGLELR